MGAHSRLLLWFAPGPFDFVVRFRLDWDRAGVGDVAGDHGHDVMVGTGVLESLLDVVNLRPYFFKGPCAFLLLFQEPSISNDFSPETGVSCVVDGLVGDCFERIAVAEYVKVLFFLRGPPHSWFGHQRTGVDRGSVLGRA